MQIDPVRRRLDAKIVLWGPARGGKTTSLRSLHGAFAPTDRGTLASVDTQDERTYFFDYAPLDAPRWHDLEVRAHVYTVPGQESYVETRRRILRGADAVVFVADAEPGASGRTLASWRQLDDALRLLEMSGAGVPVVVAANKQDVRGAASVASVARSLSEAVPARAPRAVHGTSAVVGRGVLACFRDALVAALAVEAGPQLEPEAVPAFASAWARRLHGGVDGIAVTDAPSRRVISVPITSNDPDAGGVEAALASVAWLRDGDEALAAVHATAEKAAFASETAATTESAPTTPAVERPRATEEAWDALARLRASLARLDEAQSPPERADALRDARRAADRAVDALRRA